MYQGQAALHLKERGHDEWIKLTMGRLKRKEYERGAGGREFCAVELCGRTVSAWGCGCVCVREGEREREREMEVPMSKALIYIAIYHT